MNSRESQLPAARGLVVGPPGNALSRAERGSTSRRAPAEDQTAGTPKTARVSGRGDPPRGLSILDVILNPLINFFTSLRLTVVCLVLGIMLVFFGTMAQDPMGLYLAQNEFFRSFFVSSASMWAAIKKTLQMVHVFLPPSTAADVLRGARFPVFPGGYMIGGILLINLLASHFKRFTFSRAKAGIWMVHFGLILLLLGQLGTDLVSRESVLHLREGEARNYSESSRQVELALMDTTDPGMNTVVAIPQALLTRGREIRNEQLPFAVQVNGFYPNSSVEDRSTSPGLAPASTQGVGANALVREQPRVTDTDQRDIPSAVVELTTPQGSLGTWLVSEFVKRPQTFTFNNRSYELVMRLRRYYEPFTIQLLQFRHDIYAGTGIPKNFSSRIRLQRPDTSEDREVLIKMNSPLRYAGETYYQSSYDPDDHGSILQVVHNPSWLTPYFSCVLVGAGLVLQFATHLFGFTLKRKRSA